jgi:hypothetical protein
VTSDGFGRGYTRDARRSRFSWLTVGRAAGTALLLGCLLGGASCAGGRKPWIMGTGADFVELYPVAQSACTSSLSGEALGTAVTVHYEPRIGEATARRFLEGLELFQRERAADYEILRNGLRTHLGDALYARAQDKAFLQTKELEPKWFLMAGEEPGHILWHGTPGSTFHYLPPPAGDDYTAEELQVRSRLRWEVHELTHWTIWSITTSRRNHLPRWIEEGICDYVAMQFQRWKDKEWDDGRELLARLAWDRPAVRAHLTEWVSHDGWISVRRAIREPEWTADLHFAGSLGLVFGLESELGSGGLLELIKQLLVESPETDRATVALIEATIGKPIREVGRIEPVARRAILDGLLERAATACDGPLDTRGLPLRALGHFPEFADEVVPALHSLTACTDLDIAEQGLAGLCYLGSPEALEAALHQDAAETDPGFRERLERTGTWSTAREMLESKGRVVRWFEAERDRAERPAALSGTHATRESGS